MSNNRFLPVSIDDINSRGWNQLDIIIVSGDAYVDHPSFGVAIISRLLEQNGYRVGIIPQPDWHNNHDFLKLGLPRLFFAVTAGNMDSLVCNRTSSKRARKSDVYSPSGKGAMRPDRAVIVYSNMIRQINKSVPIVIGGIEASLRRLAHYDYWSNKVRRSILLDSRADILVYGMGEKPILEIAKRIKDRIGESNDFSGIDLSDINGTALMKNNIDTRCEILAFI